MVHVRFDQNRMLLKSFFFFFEKGSPGKSRMFQVSLFYLAVILAAAFPGVVFARGFDASSSSFVAGATTTARGTAAPSSLCVPSMNLRTAYNFPFLAAHVTAATRNQHQKCSQTRQHDIAPHLPDERFMYCLQLLQEWLRNQFKHFIGHGTVWQSS